MLIHLEEMYIEACRSMEEIVGEEQNEIATEEIKFERLWRICLRYLSGLKRFYSGNATLKLPSLIQVDIVWCYKLENFSGGLIHVEPSRRIQVFYDPHDDLDFHHDLNTVGVCQCRHQERLHLGDYPVHEAIWLRRVPIPDDWSSCKLKYLEVEGCKFLPNAVLLSHLLPFLSNLEVLEVRNCDSVEAIFDVKNTPTHASNMIVIPLKKLTLEQLPTLRHVWNKDPKGGLSFPFLDEVIVNECQSIESLFRASVAKDKLKELNVRNCVELVEIVAQDEAAPEEANKELVIFPRIASLTLRDLPKLMCICSGVQILDWPELKYLDVSIKICQKLNIFSTVFQDRFAADMHGFDSAEKVIIPHLEGLSLNKEDVVMIGQVPGHVDLQSIKFLRLQGFNDELDAFPDDFFSKLLLGKIEKFGLIDSAFKEIFHSQKPGINYTKILSQLKALELRSLRKLNSIGFEHTRMASLLQNLKVLECSCLTNLAPSTVSFSYLSLEYLFTSSTAKSLVALCKMYISNCESLETVVAEEEDKRDKYVKFTKLDTLSLMKLRKLGSFYTGESTMGFPELRHFSITQCKSMKTFSHGEALASNKPMVIIDEVGRLYDDLNTAVRRKSKKGRSPELA